MQTDAMKLKRQAEAADVTQTEIAYHSPDRAVSRSKVCRIFRGYETASDEELQAIHEGIRAAARERARKLSAAVPGVLDGFFNCEVTA